MVLSVAILIVVIAPGITVFWFSSPSGAPKSELLSTPEPQETSPPVAQETTTPATNVAQMSPQYLSGYVLQPVANSSYGEVFESATRIFLVSVTTYYGYSNSAIESINPTEPNLVNAGDPIFIINVTLRNDYNDQNPLPVSSDSHAFIFFDRFAIF